MTGIIYFVIYVYSDWAGRLADDAQGTNGVPIEIGYNKVYQSNNVESIGRYIYNSYSIYSYS